MFSFKASPAPKLQASSLFAYHAARNVMWTNVLTRLKVAVSWHISILCVCTMAPREFGLSIHVKNHSALIIIFLEMPLPIFRIVQEKTRVWWIQNTPHTLQTEATSEAFRGTAYQWVTEECGRACHDKLLLSDHLAFLKFWTMAVRSVVGIDQLYAAWHDSISVPPLEIWDRCRPVVFTDERTLLNGAVVHRSVNMALASQIVPLVDSGLGPKLYLAQRTQVSLGGGLKPDRG